MLREIAHLSREGDYDSASDKAHEAFARLQSEEEERRASFRAQGLSILQSGLDQDLLRRNAVSAAERVVQMVELQAADPKALFEALRATRREWHEHGRDKGLNLDLEVAIEIAKLVVLRAFDADERGAAQINLGNALATLGERQTGTTRLDEAVTAFREALRERTRDRVPLHWAMSWGNQGVAMSLLAERKADCDLARLAATQIAEARDVMREADHAPFAAYYEHHLPLAEARVAQLCGQG